MSIPFTAAQLDAVLTGNTATVATPAGPAYFYYGSDGRAAARLPDGTPRNGTWKLDGDAYAVIWSDAPAGRTQMLRTGDGWTLRDAATATPRGSVVQLRAGNPEGL